MQKKIHSNLNSGSFLPCHSPLEEGKWFDHLMRIRPRLAWELPFMTFALDRERAGRSWISKRSKEVQLERFSENADKLGE